MKGKGICFEKACLFKRRAFSKSVHFQKACRPRWYEPQSLRARTPVCGVCVSTNLLRWGVLCRHMGSTVTCATVDTRGQPSRQPCCRESDSMRATTPVFGIFVCTPCLLRMVSRRLWVRSAELPHDPTMKGRLTLRGASSFGWHGARNRFHFWKILLRCLACEELFLPWIAATGTPCSESH